MPSKEDFYNYAKRSYTGQSNNGFEKYDASTDVRNETSSNGVWGEYQTDVDSITESIGTAEELQRTSSITSGQQSEFDGGTNSSNWSSNGTSTGTGSSYRPSRNLDGSTYIAPTAISANAPRIRRKSFLDKAKNKIDKFSQEVKKQVHTTTAPRTKNGTLTAGEITRNRPQLVQLILWSSEHLDHGISAITRGHKEVEIWSNLQQVDAEILADAFQSAGQRSVWVADKVRMVMDYHEKLKVGIILAPRVYKTIMYTVTTGIDLRM